jgi:putative flippase GtrA
VTRAGDGVRPPPHRRDCRVGTLLGSPPVEPSSTAGVVRKRTRAGHALRRPANWLQLIKFSIVGASGYVINLAVYTALLRGAGLHYLAAAACSFLVAVTNNYVLNRVWTFRGQRGHFAYQGLRFLVVSLVALGANLLILHLLVSAGLNKVLAQAIAIVLVTPLNFIGNKLWSFRR